MATTAKRGRPGVVLTVFLLVIVGLYAIMALTNTWKPNLGLDLQGGQTITLEATNKTVPMESMELARDIIQQRIDGLGVGEATEVVVLAGRILGEDGDRLDGAVGQGVPDRQ